MPHYVDALFALAGEDATAHFTYQQQEESCRYFWEDGTRLTAWSDAQRFAQEVETVLGVSGTPLLKHLQRSQMIYESTGHIFMEKSLHKAGTWLSADVARALLKIPQLGLFETMNDGNQRALNHPKLLQLFNRFATYNGSNPYSAP